MQNEESRMTGSAEQAPADDLVAANLRAVRARIVAAAEAVGRDPAKVTLVALSKAQPDARVQAALAAGQRVFGENYLQEAKARWPALRALYPDVGLHMIGLIHTNKDAVAPFDMIETGDRPKLARVLAAKVARQGRWAACSVREKSGLTAADADDACNKECRDDLGLPVVGLMAIPPEDEEPSLHFALLADIARRNGLDRLSMGLSADYEIAVQFGATHVRVGRAFFGERPPKTGSTA
jgi:PLP dependent protein